MTVDVLHFSDPGCPWAYCAAPHLAVLHWRYGSQLRWRLVLIGLAEEARQYSDRGYTPGTMAAAYRRFRARGMPFSTQPRARVPATARACRAVVATRLDQPELEWHAFRALQHAWFTTPLLLDEDDAVARALAAEPALDADRIVARLDDPHVTEAYETGRREARTAAGSPTEVQGKAADTDGAVRYTAPSLIFAAGDRRLEAGGFQSTEAYDVCVANLDPTLDRRAPATDVAGLLAAFPAGLTTREIAACMAPDKDQPDDDAAEDALIAAAAAGAVTRAPLGSGALWRAAG